MKTICCPPKIPIIEYEIFDDEILEAKKGFYIPLKKQNIKCLIDKVINNFLDILCQLEKGIQPDLTRLIEMISLIEVEQDIDKRDFLIQYYLNNE